MKKNINKSYFFLKWNYQTKSIALKKKEKLKVFFFKFSFIIATYLKV